MKTKILFSILSLFLSFIAITWLYQPSRFPASFKENFEVVNSPDFWTNVDRKNIKKQVLNGLSFQTTNNLHSIDLNFDLLKNLIHTNNICNIYRSFKITLIALDISINGENPSYIVQSHCSENKNGWKINWSDSQVQQSTTNLAQNESTINIKLSWLGNFPEKWEIKEIEFEPQAGYEMANLTFTGYEIISVRGSTLSYESKNN